MFGLTGEALANRVRDAVKAAGLGDNFSGHSGRIGMARRVVAAGAPTAVVQHLEVWPESHRPGFRYAKQTYYSRIWHNTAYITLQHALFHR